MTTLRDWLERPDTLTVIRETPAGPELFLAVEASGRVTAFNGHVDLGTGISTSLAQIVAEEMNLGPQRVEMVLGHTALAPNQGATIASETIQVAAIPLRAAAAQAQARLMELAAAALGLPAAELEAEDGLIRPRAAGGSGAQGVSGDNAVVSYGELLAGRQDSLILDPAFPTKPREAYRVVGKSSPRIDIPAKATGRHVYVHDVRVPGMLHGRVVRPPYAGLDAGPFVGTSLIGVDKTSVSHLPGLVEVVAVGDFVGVVAEREEQAMRAAEALVVHWKELPVLTDLDDLAQAISANPSRPRKLLDKGDVEAAVAGAAKPMARQYLWPYHLHGSIGPSCGVADWSEGGLKVWSGTQNPHILRGDLARLLDLPEERVEIVRHEAAGCYGRNCADDVCADAALLSRAVGRPVRVQLTREQEHAWEPKGTAQLMTVRGGLTAEGEVAGYDFQTRYPSNGAPLLAALLTGAIPPEPQVWEMGDRTSIAPYDFGAMRVVVHDMPPIVRASWLRGVSALPNTFAHESYIDELAAEAGIDPIEYRLRYLKDPRAVELIKAVAEKAGWEYRTGPRLQVIDSETVRGQGFAYAVYIHGKFPGTAAAWAAWVAEVEVNRATGEVVLTRVTAGQDSGMVVNPAGVTHQIHGNVIQSAGRVLKEEVRFDNGLVESREWGSYPLLRFPELPEINVLMMPRDGEPPLGVGESASVPSAAAIANAIFDATGVRLREVPFTPDRVKAALNAGGLPAPRRAKTERSAKKTRRMAALAASVMAGLTLGVVNLPLRSAIAPIRPPAPDTFSAATLERGRQLAALGDCAVCHTAPGGMRNAGGYVLETPFGVISTPNITPDPDTGIGRWSYSAFERAMRHGIGRDGRQLYPAHPYTAFAKTEEADLQALYAHLMAQEPVRAEAGPSRLVFPFNLRPVMAAWNLMFHDPAPFAPDPARSAQWNRGAYLVEGLGHCSACHTPRNLAGAEKTGAAKYAGGVAHGWEAPALNAASLAPLGWSEDDLFAYLRTGFSPRHGVAAGPMAPVVRELAAVPDADIRAMAAYLASFAKPATEAPPVEARLDPGTPGATLYDGACAVCHDPNGPTLFGARPLLGLNTSLNSDSPDNLLRVILDGIMDPAHPDLGAMPGFRNAFSPRQTAELAQYLRARFAPNRPAWTGLEERAAQLAAGH